MARAGLPKWQVYSGHPAPRPSGRPAAVQNRPGDFVSLHAGVTAEAHQRDKLERVCRYIARPAVSEKHLSLLEDGRIRYELKTPYRDGTTHVFFEPLDFLARLAALVPRPRVNLTRFARIIPDAHPLRGPAKAVQIHSR